MKRISFFALTILIATCTATAPSISELRMTPTEITRGDKGKSRSGVRNSPESIRRFWPATRRHRFLFHFAIRPRTQDHSSPLAS